ncbi:glycoside hydrolase family 17 [Artemisia annua]|uniref:Glycoside hydrolase family 17 n=1 Tax=Artemisia annua TaxID=35608 RepID=A0A2U1NHV8_ARTAN|nr:glycoside hydrolase family 17 [Artemisia annua]
MSIYAEAQVGVCYGLLGDNLPTPAQVISLYKSQNIKRMRLYDPYNQEVLQALRGSNIEVMIGVPNSDLAYVAASRDNAFDWVSKNVRSLPDVNFRYIAVGNEVKPSDKFAPLVHPALTNIHEVISIYGLKDKIKVSTSVDTTLIGVSYPPSEGAFRDDAMSYLNPIIGFLVAINAPLLVNVYPYFRYISFGVLLVIIKSTVYLFVNLHPSRFVSV